MVTTSDDEARAGAVDFGFDPLPASRLHQVLAVLRERDPVVWVRFQGRDALLFTRFADVREAFRDDDRFPGASNYQLIVEPVVGRTFISMGGREHDLYRKLAAPAFSSRAVAQFDEQDLEPLTHAVIDRFARRGEADLVRELTTVIPFSAITRKLGLPESRDEDMRRWADKMLSFPTDPEGARAAAREFSTQLGPLLAQRRAEPREDLLSELAIAEVEGERLSDEEIFATIRLLFAVGATTTSHAMGNLLWTLLGRRELLDAARTDAGLRARIVHELLRFEGPLGVLPRYAPHDTDFAGASIPGGTVLLFGIASANRDPRVFADPDRFDPDRPPGEIVTFGFGRKFCPGSHLARRELLTALGVVLERLPGLHLTQASGCEPRGATLRHPEALHVAWDA
jgi:cytochrome P450